MLPIASRSKATSAPANDCEVNANTREALSEQAAIDSLAGGKRMRAPSTCTSWGSHDESSAVTRWHSVRNHTTMNR